MLTSEQATQVWKLFGNSPLFSKWTDARHQLPLLLEPVPLPANGVIFRPGDTPGYLYLVVDGLVEQTVRYEDRIWLRMTFRAGQFFGQQGLFAGEYRSQAVAAPDSVLFQMSAANLRVALEWNPGLRDILLQEQRASRLRGIPLLSSLEDDQIKWLAQVVEEHDLAPDAPVPQSKPGIWIVDWGQVRVKGPANPHPEEWPEWGITAGNLFIFRGGGLRFGEQCVAETARAHVKSHLFYLPAEHADRLIAAFPEIGEYVRRPLDAASVLAADRLFQGLQPRQLQHLAQFCAWEFVPAGQAITTQGSVGHSYVIIRRGAAVVAAVDDRGRSRPRNYLRRGDSYGATSLLEGKERDATVRAVAAPAENGQPGLRGAELIILDRRDLRYAFAEQRRLWPSNVELVRRAKETKQAKQPYDWMGEGEVLRWRGRGHLFWLLVPELGGVALAVAVFLVMSWLRGQAASLISAVIVTGLIAVPLGIWIAYNYYDDYYAVTNRRVTRRDRTALIHELRLQAPIEMVQDVTVDTNLLTRLFGFGDVTIRTAAKVGAIVFAHVPDPDTVKGYILQERAEATSAQRGRQKEILRRGLISDLGLALPIPERKRALGEDVQSPDHRAMWRRLWHRLRPRQAKPELLPGTPRGKPQWLIRATQRLSPRWQKILIGEVNPPPRPLAGQFIWRKHRLNLIKRAGLPFLTLLLLLSAPLVLARSDVRAWGVEPTAVFLPWGLICLVALVWFLWNYIDYRNDIYVVTDDKIIDIEQKPFGLFAKRKEGNLDRVQTVECRQEGIWANLFNYGDVIIRTAAADEGYDFLMVPHPRAVQSIIFQKLDALRARQEEQRTRERQRELTEALEVYHQLANER